MPDVAFALKDTASAAKYLLLDVFAANSCLMMTCEPYVIVRRHDAV